MAEVKSELRAALLRAQEQVKVALKRSKNTHHGYQYASAEEVLAVGREALTKNGILLLPRKATFVPQSDMGGGAGLLHYEAVLLHSGGEGHEVETDVPVCPDRGRPLDKALFAARTEGLGYLLRDVLLIPRKDAPDVSGRRDEEPEPRPVAQRPPPAPRESPKAQTKPAAPVEAIHDAPTLDVAASLLIAAREAGGAEQHEVAFVARATRALADVKTAQALEVVVGQLNAVKAKGGLGLRNAVEDARTRLRGGS